MEINITLDDARHAKVDRMESRLTEAFAEVFNIPGDEASRRVGLIMELLEDSGFVGDLMEDYPVTVDDLQRLGHIQPEEEPSLLATLARVRSERPTRGND